MRREEGGLDVFYTFLPPFFGPMKGAAAEVPDQATRVSSCTDAANGLQRSATVADTPTLRAAYIGFGVADRLASAPKQAGSVQATLRSRRCCDAARAQKCSCARAHAQAQAHVPSPTVDEKASAVRDIPCIPCASVEFLLEVPERLQGVLLHFSALRRDMVITVIVLHCAQTCCDAMVLHRA